MTKTIEQSKRVLVATTINPPIGPMAELVAGAHQHRVPLVIAGDTKTPSAAYAEFQHYLDVDAQHARFGEFSRGIPTRHYARKNLGYLYAAAMGATEIQETDDDNAPYPSFWDPVPVLMPCERIRCDRAWLNVYALFCRDFVWPRGLPLEEIQQPNPHSASPAESRALIVQDLADDNPDVDAVYRLTRPLPVRFDRRAPIVLDTGVWCPFNSQATIFRREVFPLLYLPAFCSFRMTDIWRSLVAQRCLWEHGEGVVFRSATVRQDRNEHNLLRDFESEVPGYLRNDLIRRNLESLKLRGPDPVGNLMRCYESLTTAELLSKDELPLVRQWCDRITRP